MPQSENYNDLIFKNNYLNGKLAIVLPHPSPLNIKWFKDHPEFMEKRIFEIRKIVKGVLEEEKNDRFETNTKRCLSK